MRIAAFNVENLFDRARALNQQTWAQGKPILTKHGRINALLNKPFYSAADKQKIKELLLDFGLEKRDDGGEWVILRQDRGKLLKRLRAGGLEIVANGRDDWIGCVAQEHLRTYAHAVRDRTEIDYADQAEVLS